ncbi:MAG: DUF5717 family protein [Lachnospiraceae bacterium]|nr:DUF5717 family protein [Lachnospiraceae bacterium]
MLDKIKSFAREEFTYELPGIVLSDDVISVTVETGKVCNGSFTVHNSDFSQMKGIVYSTNQFLKIRHNTFQGTYNTIEYSFDATNAEAGQKITANFQIVSDCGECNLAFGALITEAFTETSLGKIKDLFDFANLAKTDFREAAKIFGSEEFGRVFLRENERSSLIYEALMKSTVLEQAMEEFLIAEKKKQPVRLFVDHTQVSFEDPTENCMERIDIRKENWGYLQAKVQSNVSFLKPQKSVLRSEDFTANAFHLDVLVDVKELHPGKNEGKIVITSICDTIEISFVIMKRRGEAHTVSYYERNFKSRMLHNYLEFRTGKINHETYIYDAWSLIRVMEQYKDSTMLDLFRLHLYIISRQEDEAIRRIRELEKHIEEFSTEEKAAFWYLKAMFTRREEDILDAASTIRGFYENGYDNWRMLWFLLYLDVTYEFDVHKKFKDIMNQLDAGVHSPVLYQEICAMVNKNPILLLDLTPSAIRCMNWGIRMQYLQDNAIDQYLYLAENAPFHPVVFRNMLALYDKRGTKDVLTLICRMLIKKDARDEQAFEWYRLAVEEELKIEDLFEYYIYSIDEEKAMRGRIIPENILLYFVYGSTMNAQKQAFLFSYVLRYGYLNNPVYSNYEKLIQEWLLLNKDNAQTKELIELDKNYAVLYKYAVTDENLEELSPMLSELVFGHTLYCDNPNIRGVWVWHKERRDGAYVPLQNGKADVHIYTEDTIIALEDMDGRCYIDTVKYQLQKLGDMESLARKCLLYQKDNEALLLHAYEKIVKYQKQEKRFYEIYESIVAMEDIRESLKNELLRVLLHYYYDKIEEPKVLEILDKIDLKYLNEKHRGEVINIAIIYDAREFILHAVGEYSIANVPVGRLARFCTDMIERSDSDEESDILTYLSFRAFIKGKYNEIMLRYLIRHFNGTTKDMYRIWEAAKEKQLETKVLEERLLSQMLFAENYVRMGYDVFASYYAGNGDRKVIRAYLAYNAYKYLIMDRVIHPEIYSILAREASNYESKVVTLALLKYYSGKSMLNTEELGFVDYNLDSFIRQGIILPFFKDFRDKLDLPQSLMENTYIEYTCEPTHTVKIHYVISNDDGQEEFVSQVMENTFHGIHVCPVLLFYGDTLQYYITEHDGQEEHITESLNYTLDNNEETSGDTEYHIINTILESYEVRDEKTMFNMLRYYLKKNYAGEKMFKPL